MRLDDPRWKTLEGGYRVLYDASDDLKALSSGDENAFSRLWQELHHQGDVGQASYAAVPALIEIYASRTRDWNFYGLINLIEICRHKDNPPLPEWLELEYSAALRALLGLAIQDLARVQDALTLKHLLASIAIAKGDGKLGEVIGFQDDSDIDAIFSG
jgi:hypothetical protein